MATVRPADIDDLPVVFDFFYAHEVADAPHPPPRGAVPPRFTTN